MFLEIIMIRSKILSGNEASGTQLSLALFQYRLGYFGIDWVISERLGSSLIPPLKNSVLLTLNLLLTNRQFIASGQIVIFLSSDDDDCTISSFCFSIPSQKVLLDKSSHYPSGPT